MRLLQLIGGIVSLGLGLVLCVPAVRLVWQFLAPVPAGASGQLPAGNTIHHDFLFGIGNLTISGSQLWVLATGLAVAGAATLMLGIYILYPRRAGGSSGRV